MKKTLALIACFIFLFALVSCMKLEEVQSPTAKPSPSPEPTQIIEEIGEGLDITDKKDIISICYSTWFTKILGTGKAQPQPPNISKILAGEEDWGNVTQFHYWAKPQLGYYRSHDKDVIRQHMIWLQEAGVDFIIIDNTNASIGWVRTGDWAFFVTKPVTALCDVILEMRAEGLKTPYVVFWSRVNEDELWGVVEKTYDQFYKDGKYKDCFVYWEGKPLHLSTSILDNPPEEFTIRHMWGLARKLNVSQWSFLNILNIPSYDSKGNVEQMAVCTATQETYMTEPTAHGRNHGIFFYDQWTRAFEYRPKVITISCWNEWAAQRFLDDNGNSRFVDSYSIEYSRDIEPMEGGHGDQYYQWMKEYIRAYKAHEECPRLVEAGY